MRWSAPLTGHPRLRAVLLVLLLAVVGVTLVHLHVDRDIVAIVLVLVGLATKALAALIGLVALVPVVGPILVQLITLPFVLLVNGLAYVVTFFALRRGEAMEVVRAKIIAWSVLVGFILGFLAGRAH